VHGKHAKTALMSQADWEHLCINFNLVAEKCWAPIDILGAEDDGLFIRPMLEDGHVDGLVEL